LLCSSVTHRCVLKNTDKCIVFVTFTTVTTKRVAFRGVTLCSVLEVYRIVTGMCIHHHGQWVNLTRKWLANSSEFSVYRCARLRDVTSRRQEHTKNRNLQFVCSWGGLNVFFGLTVSSWCHYRTCIPSLLHEAVTLLPCMPKWCVGYPNYVLNDLLQSLQWILGNRPIFKHTFSVSIPFTAYFCGRLWTVTVDKVPLKYTYLPKN
jgi:hypothetical protein